MNEKTYNQWIRRLPAYVFVLFAMQIGMDVLSFWSARLEWSNLPTLLLRFGTLAVTVLLGFVISKRKKVYWIAAGIFTAIAAAHGYALFDHGCTNLFSDLTNYVRVIQMPLMVLCLITFMEANPRCYEAMKWGMTTCLLLTLAVQILAVLTGTEPYTYRDHSGYIGWFSNTNSQSANLCMFAPVVIAFVHQKVGFRNPFFWLVTLGCSVALFFLGTRLAYLGLVVTALGLGISVLLICVRDWKKAMVFFLLALLFVGLIPMSPMVRHQTLYESTQSGRQQEINEYIDSCNLPSLREKGLSEAERNARQERWVEALTPIYEEYVKDFVQIFGMERSIAMYDYSYDIYTLTVTRPKKIRFARLLMEESPVSAQAFGLELSRFTAGGVNYDVENDLHGMYFLYGWTGLIAMLLFLLYFVYLILWALIHNAKRYFTWDAASWGIAFLLVLPHIYCTAGVLRRPNASIYLSAVLAGIYYLVKLHSYPQTEEDNHAA